MFSLKVLNVYLIEEMQRQHVANGLNCRLFNKAKDPEYTVLIGIVKTGRAQSVSTYETNFL